MTPDGILVLLLINTSVAASFLRPLGIHLLLSGSSRQSLQSENVTRRGLLSLMTTSCPWRSSPSRALSLSAVPAVSAQWESTCGRLPLSLTARGTTSEEVSGHLSLPFHLHHPSTLQLVSVVGQHMVQVSGHLGKDMDD